MSINFQIRFENRNGNLHIRPTGDFDGIRDTRASPCVLKWLFLFQYRS